MAARCTSDRANGLYAATINLQADAAQAGGGARGAREDAAAPRRRAGPAANATARQVTYTANLEVDHKALRAQVFNEGWRIMKNRFYDAKMHGANWREMKTIYEPLLDYLVDDDELHTVMMMMIGQLNASHTGVSGAPGDNRRRRADALSRLRPRRRCVRLLQGRTPLQGWPRRQGLPEDQGRPLHHRGRRSRLEDDGQLLAALHAIRSGQKFHFLINDKPAKDGAWDVTITPRHRPGIRRSAVRAVGRAIAARWWPRPSNGEIGYLHIRAMDAPSLRQFQLDLAANRTKKALVIDQRFNGGGGIDQELLSILAGRQYQYTMGRDAGFQQPRPQNFYGPMVVMQNERSASDAEMFPAGFKALGLGKVVGVPTMGAVIGTGSYTLLDGFDDPHARQRRVDGDRREHGELRRAAGRLVDNTPADFLKGRDAQIEKAVEVLKEQLADRKTVDAAAVGLRP